MASSSQSNEPQRSANEESSTADEAFFQSRIKATLFLDDGSQFSGFSFGATTRKNVSGECVFQTGMVGYPESLTDPSYRGQILILTYPLVGNYGVPPETRDECGIPHFFESDHIHAAALIVADYSHQYCHWNAVRSLGNWLVENNIPALYGIDTRALTKRIRERGCTLGKIVFDNDDDDDPLAKSLSFENPNLRNLVDEVSTKQVKRYFGSGGQSHSRLRIMAIDCGMKYNQIRCLLRRGVELIVVPWNYDIVAAREAHEFDGLFISNGPGDPTMCASTIENLRRLLAMDPPCPVFGICLGNQLLGLAAGARTFKLPYGNRGHNQPCIDLETGRCYITSQNHGFAVDPQSLDSSQWSPFFSNANDRTNEGIIHKSKPFFSVQFHPEACGGPADTEFLFDMFLELVRGASIQEARKTVCGPAIRPAQIPQINKVVVIGSGGLSIGQAGEFDYSGSQAIKALNEEGIKTVLINPNIATVQTSPGLADKVYFLPVTPEFIVQVLENEKPDGILLTFGGQTALNCGIELHKRGVFEKLGVKILGTPIEAIIATEDREIFATKLEEIHEHIAPSCAAQSVEQALVAASNIGFPVIVRAGFALGGLGSGFANNKQELTDLAQKALAVSDQILIEKSLKGWKEIEYEVIRDAYDNCLTVCNMENFDPLGVHTGESIVVSPSQTLSDREYNMLRTTAIKVVRHFGIIGECNIQYALDPDSEKYCIIEVNARLSRSSALASKATGYPLAFVSAKLAICKSLPELRNAVTKVTTACFEPSLDYIVVKMPKWDLRKFERVDTKISSAMKSVGEVMSIGRTFEEAIQKAIRMVNTGANSGIEGFHAGVAPASDDELENPSDERIHVIASALKLGYSVGRIHQLTKIDKWFLFKLKRILDFEQHVLCKTTTNTITSEIFWTAKQLGFSDKYIARCLHSTELAIRTLRLDQGVVPHVKQVDTVAAEFPAFNNYLYTTYSAIEDDIDFADHGVIVIGSGAYRIGCSVEFDWCSVSCIHTLTKLGFKTIVINYNPETVSTDFDECDRLYLDELSTERVLDIYTLEKAAGVILAMGGQISNNLAMPLYRQHVNILGTSPEMIDNAENRYKFSRMLDRLGIDQPQWKELTAPEEIKQFCDSVGYPCLVRPSYVLSGAAMNVVYSSHDLEAYLNEATMLSPEHPVVISKFIQEAKEIELDAVAQKGLIMKYAISEHVENAGVHSGDATLVCPAQDLDPITVARVLDIGAKIASALQVSGPFNMQFIAKHNEVKVIECNLRASRSFPFVSKVYKTDFIDLATRIIMEAPIDGDPLISGTTSIASIVSAGTQADRQLGYVGLKVAQFSFTRLRGADPVLGVEMASTGEVACFGKNRSEAYLKALLSAGFVLPQHNILLSIGSFKAKAEFLDSARKLVELGFNLMGTPGTADYYSENGVKIMVVSWPHESNDADPTSSITEQLRTNNIHLFINIPSPNKYRRPSDFMSRGYLVRRMAIDFDVPLLTNIKCAKLFVEALCTTGATVDRIPVSSLDTRSSNRIVTLPGLIDVHANFREPGATQKEDWDSGSAAALAGGFTLVCATPNTNPPITGFESFALAQKLAASKSRCDFALFIGATNDNLSAVSKLATSAAALKLYLDPRSTEYAASQSLVLKDLTTWMEHVKNWPFDIAPPISVHADTRNLGAILLMGLMYNKPIHVCCVSTREEILLIRAAKEKSSKLTCEVAPHHLFLTTDDVMSISTVPSDSFGIGTSGGALFVGRSEVIPRLGTVADRDALWENLDIIDCFVSAHAPHLVEEKHGPSPPPGFPNLETALPLLLTAVNEGRLTIDDIILRLYTNPRRIFNLPEQPDTWVEVDMDHVWTIPPRMRYSKCGWTPFAGRKVQGSVRRVMLRGKIAYVDGKVLASPGLGVNVRITTPISVIKETAPVVSVEAAPVVPTALVSPVLHPATTTTTHLPAGSPLLRPTARTAPLSSSPQALHLGENVVASTASASLIQQPSSAGVNNFFGRSIITVKQFSRTDLHLLFDVANTMRRTVKNSGSCDLLRGFVQTNLFYEPSTRTNSSFAAAMQRLGGSVIQIHESTSSVVKGETLEDTVRTLQCYADVIVMRHPQAGSVERAAKVLNKPIINAGDGTGEHPSQALLDVFTIRDELGTVNGLTITMVGDLKNGRTVHSLVRLLSLYKVKLNYVSPATLRMPIELVEELRQRAPDMKQHEHNTLTDAILAETDVLYVTRVQKERFSEIDEYNRVAGSYTITPDTLQRCKKTAIVMHPLPRVGEISTDVDFHPSAAYFRQVENGMYVRMALLALVLGRV